MVFQTSLVAIWKYFGFSINPTGENVHMKSVVLIATYHDSYFSYIVAIARPLSPVHFHMKLILYKQPTKPSFVKIGFSQTCH